MGEADRHEVELAWLVAAQAGGACGPAADPTRDVDGDGCVDVGDVQAVATAAGGAAAPQLVAATTSTFVVNSVGDGDDAAADGLCQTSTAGECTLRAAITESNRTTGHDTITFAIPGSGIHTLTPASRFPALSDTAGVTIDATTQPGATVNTDPAVDNAAIAVEIVGTGASGIDGFFVSGAGNVVKGLSMRAFRRAVWLLGGGSSGNTVVGNFLGTNPAGTYDAAGVVTAGSSCVVMQGGANHNAVGGPAPADRNVISGCSHQGVATYDNLTTANTIRGNLIGLNPQGTARRSNQSHGVDINTYTTDTVVGGTGPGEANTISGNLQAGVEISHGTGTLRNKVIGNRIGSDTTGLAAAAFTVNGQFGVRLEGYADCHNSPCPQDAGLSEVTSNVIVNNGSGGVFIDKGVHDSKVVGNRIGLTANGTPAGNSIVAVRIEAGAINTLVKGNEIAFNTNGIQIQAIGANPGNTASTVTDRNTLSQNSIHDQRNLGIDLAPFGTPNEAGVGSTDVNDGIALPVLGTAQPALAHGTACAGCTVEVFIADKAVGSFGSGRNYLSTTTADSSGAFAAYLPPSARGGAITATATDAAGNTSEFARNVAVPRPTSSDVPPKAALTASCTQLRCDLDGSRSTDADGTIAHHGWSFGDGTSGEGALVSHHYARPGTYTVTLTVADDQGATATASTTVVATNQAPTAAFTVSCTNQRCGFDGTSSTDADGTVAGWAWDFGDGTTGTGATVSHLYKAGGSYHVALVATDNDGATGATARDVPVDPLPSGTVVADVFSRTVTSGWGDAEPGGTWAFPSGQATSYAVDGAAGVATVAAGAGRSAALPTVSVADSSTRLSLTPDRVPVGGTYGVTAAVVARRVASNTEYRLRVRFAPGGAVLLGAVKVVGSSSEVLIAPEVTLSGVTAAPGAALDVRFQVSGTQPTTLSGQAWPAGTAEPAAWALVVTDAQAELQGPGSPGLAFYVASGTTNGPVAVRVDDVSVRDLSAAAPAATRATSPAAAPAPGRSSTVRRRPAAAPRPTTSSANASG